jgi:hypothetical protein
MIANTENIQLIYSDFPNTYIVDGVRIDNYSQSNDHFLHGWREVVIPSITEFQRLGDEFILVNNIVTKEVIDFTAEEIEAYNRSLIPKEILRMKFKIQIRRSTIYSYDIILTYLKNLAVNEQFTQDDKDDLIDRLEDAVSFNRYHKDFINLANMLGVSDEKKDEIFINGNLLD